MPLTVGRIGDTRRVGGKRAAIRTEIRRAKRSGNTGLANSLGAQLANENLRRAEHGESLIGSADSDIREGLANQRLRRHQATEGARLATSGLRTTGLADSGGLKTTGLADSGGLKTTGLADARDPKVTPATPQTTSKEPADPAALPSTPPPPVQNVPEPVSAVAEPTQGTINGLPTGRALAQSRFAVDSASALDRGEVPTFDSPEESLSATALSERRQKYYADFEDRHGTEALLQVLKDRVELRDHELRDFKLADPLAPDDPAPFSTERHRFKDEAPTRTPQSILDRARDPVRTRLRREAGTARDKKAREREELRAGRSDTVKESLGAADPLEKDKDALRVLDTQLRRLQ